MNLQKAQNISLRVLILVLLSHMPGFLMAQNFNLNTENLFDIIHIHAYFVAAMLIGIFILIFGFLLQIYHGREVNVKNKTQNLRLSLIMQTGRLRLWTYDTNDRHYRFIGEDGNYSEEYNPVDFSWFFNRDDFEKMRSAIFSICENKQTTATILLRSNPEDTHVHYYEIHLSISRKDSKGRITQLLGVQHDITEEHDKEEKTKEVLMRYHTVFNSSLIDMLYYDKDGVLTDINEKACRSFGISSRQKLLDGKYKIEENPLFNDIDFRNADNIHNAAIIDFSKFQEDNQYRINSFTIQGKMYYEATINTIRDKNGNREGIYIAGRNVTEMVESFKQQQQGAIQLKEATRHIQEYIDNINYALRVSNVRLVNYYPESFTLDISDSVGNSQLRLSQLRCIRLAMPQYRRIASSILNRMDHHSPRDIEQIIETEIRDQKKRQISLMFNLVPIIDKEGQVERYFGMFRNMTDLIETERRLALETQKAQEGELLKQSFLTNMSYEIRTPLNTILGFAELFESEHNEADETVFVEEIKRNTNTLLQLINDILFLSKLDADMVEFKHEDFDFAEVFSSFCQIGWSRINPNITAHTENPYNHLVINGDIEHLGKAIQMLCAISASYTKEGTVRAKYEYRRDELVIIIEDTGVGFDAETVNNAFKRFGRDKDEQLYGSGLDLPIIQALIQKMGGSIELQSEKHKGTTAWIFLPCKAKVIDKKRDFIA